MNEDEVIFQSTRPMRDATNKKNFGYFNINISIHASHVGRDRRQAYHDTEQEISIHAPHAGRDDSPAGDCSSISLFQSTRPMRDATVDNVPF